MSATKQVNPSFIPLRCRTRRVSAKSTTTALVVILFLLSASPTSATQNVVDFGASGDGNTDSTVAFARAWGKACSSLKDTTVFVPSGTFMIRPISFTGPCRASVVLHIVGTILAHPNYKLLEEAGYLIQFYRVDNLSVRGGTLQGRGKPFWACRMAGKCDGGATSMSFAWCNHVEVSGLTSFYSHRVHISVFQCKFLTLRDLKLRAPSESPNTDGIHISNSDTIAVYNSVIKTGDDCISLGPGNSNFIIRRIACGPGHGISIGSLANGYNEGGVQSISVSDVVFIKTQNGVRIKSWARDSTSFVKNVIFKNIHMRNVYNPIVIDQNYCPAKQNCLQGSSGVQISSIMFKDIKGTSLTKNAVSLDCSSSHPCTQIQFQNVRLTNGKNPATAYCSHAHGWTKGKVVPPSCLQ